MPTPCDSESNPRVPRREFHAAPSDADRSLRDFIARHCPEAPVGFINRLIRTSFVEVNGAPASPETRLRPGQRVTLFLPEGAFLVAPNAQVPFTVLHEDEHIVVVDKPAGVISEPGIGHKLDTLLNGLVARYGEALDRIGPEHDFGMVHRLDKDTSGLLVLARSAEMHQRLCAQFRKREVEKRYETLVLGSLPRDSGEIRLPLGRERRAGRMRGVTGGRDAQPALTTWRVIERFAQATHVEAQPRTGRWRQIRLHFEAIGHPLAGDPEHGRPEANAEFEQRYGLRRLFLHAAALRFTHPATHQPMRFTLPLPVELAEVLKRMRNGRRLKSP